jgi:multiple sugar transport system permease protein
MISLMSNEDLVDSTIMWIPSSVYWRNYLITIRGLGLNAPYWDTVKMLFTNRAELEYPMIELRKFIIFALIPPVATLFSSMYTKQTNKVLGISILVFAAILALPKSYVDSFYVAGTTTAVTVLSSALIGYGLARFKFRLKGFFLAMMLLIYILPKTLLFIPRSMLYTDLGIKGTMFALWGPAFLGQGFQATFFILIFYQFFKIIPAQIEESAYLDGAHSFNIFIKIAIPTALPAFIIAITYGFAVNWNEMFLTNAFLSGNIKTIPMFLSSLQADWGRYADYSSATNFVNLDFTEAKSFAGTILSVVPLVIMYGFVQRFFMESIDKSGIAGE